MPCKAKRHVSRGCRIKIQRAGTGKSHMPRALAIRSTLGVRCMDAQSNTKIGWNPGNSARTKDNSVNAASMSSLLFQLEFRRQNFTPPGAVCATASMKAWVKMRVLPIHIWGRRPCTLVLCVHKPTWVTICLRSFFGIRCNGLPLPCHQDRPTIIPTAFGYALCTPASSRFTYKGSRPESEACWPSQSPQPQKSPNWSPTFPIP